ncbi:Hsp20/alpha crystallin family protein [Geoalkalibacter halelectricus]|uniref:Hsp20/alpha crystallin family protein n=1 Tax=Geoalkalibacter halelectricus TaxID=2847045 RepID=A0ABY5ZKT1_9BACT|nr:Hsp20/alpha crystallin family protein [Geoalkalibacter halelectricus]MDO3378296.1 Hsp20/alpha crystallin family protein [Geoalkalibacter halelectricus]UWZ79301.1 Hsp20/alpha crystallin family protein [Geoalkalibacter halelectricus]
MALRELMPWRKKDLSPARRDEESPLWSLRRDLNEIFERFSRSFGGGGELMEREDLWGGLFPAVDVAETDKEVLVTAELPGLDEKDIDVSLSGGYLSIRGEKKAEKENKEEQYYRKESYYGSFQRTIPLPAEVVEDQVEATYKKGMLKVKLPKSPAAQKERKKISIS